MKQLETKLMANDLFGILQPEQEQEIRIAEVKTNPNLEYLIKKYEEFIGKAIDYFEVEELYDKLKFNNKHLTSKNIEEFSLVLGNYQKLRNFFLSGYYLSRAINDSNDKEFVLHTNYLDYLIDDIGYKNNGKTITVKGNAGDWVGSFMDKGVIHLNGNYKSLSPNIKGGNIYHKEKLIVENGRKIK